MQPYRVDLTEPAEAELEAHVLYRARFSQDAAQRLHAGLLNAALSLSQMPGRCALAPEDVLFAEDVHQLLYRQGTAAYRILFRIQEGDGDGPNRVTVPGILHGALSFGAPLQDDDGRE